MGGDVGAGVGEAWSVVERAGLRVLTRSWLFRDWRSALAFVNAIGAVADAQDHHPLVELTWGRVTLFVWTHDEGGIGARDVALCRAVDALSPESRA